MFAIHGSAHMQHLIDIMCRPVQNQNDTIMAINDPAPCPQDCTILGCPLTPKEDCLYLNVYAPPQNSDQPIVHAWCNSLVLGDSYGNELCQILNQLDYRGTP